MNWLESIKEYHGSEAMPLWKWFQKITEIPRPSAKEEEIKTWILAMAKEENYKVLEDERGNLLVQVPGSTGREKEQVYIIQAHLDMVCEKDLSSSHDFEKDPLELSYSDGWIFANKTTLGADNGIGLACGLALAFDKDLLKDHPPLDLLLTVEEESGLHGAMALDPNLIRGDKLINLDSEDWGTFFVGCAGGHDWTLKKSLSFSQGSESTVFKVSLSGLKGGHSGIDIHRGRGNAIQLLSHLLMSYPEIDKLRGLNFIGGRSHNIIPRHVEVELLLEKSEIKALKSHLKKQFEILKSFLPSEDHKALLNFQEEAPSGRHRSFALKEVLAPLITFPHGVIIPLEGGSDGTPSASHNLAKVWLESDQLILFGSSRHTSEGDYEFSRQQVKNFAQAFAFQCELTTGYPGWKPDYESEMLKGALELYRASCGEEAETSYIHAGLECGVLKSKKPSLDTISFGPDIRDAHSSTEAVCVNSVGQFWNFLLDYLKQQG